MALIVCHFNFITCSEKLIKNFNAIKDSLNLVVENTEDTDTKLLIHLEQKLNSIQVDETFINSWNYDELVSIEEINLIFDIFRKKNLNP